MNKKIVLASKSKVRKNILEKNGLNCVIKAHASTPLEGQILTVDQNGEASFTSGGSGVTEVKAIAYAIALG